MIDMLARLKALPRSIKVGVIGVGNIGRGIVHQVASTPGMECLAIADILPERALAQAASMRRAYTDVTTAAGMSNAIQRGELAVCSDGLLISTCEQLDVVIDSSTGGAEFALRAIETGKHVIMMNCEADLMFGPYLLARAQSAGVVYTSADGDQHTVLKRLMNDTELWGFKTVMAGNMKGFLDRYSDPTTIIPEARKRFMDPKMCASYTDGTKLCVEMSLVANAIGARTAVPGMLGPRVDDIYHVFDHFDLTALWDGDTPLVDYTLGTRPPGGVFVIGYTDLPHQVETLSWYPCRLGPGPFYVFHRPYHLGHFEIAASIAEAALDHAPLLQPVRGFCTNVYTYAKKNLREGEVLDGIGGYAAYGMIENREGNLADPGLPICLSENLVLRRDIRKDEKILLRDVDYDPGSPAFTNYHLAQLAGKG